MTTVGESGKFGIQENSWFANVPIASHNPPTKRQCDLNVSRTSGVRWVTNYGDIKYSICRRNKNGYLNHQNVDIDKSSVCCHGSKMANILFEREVLNKEMKRKRRKKQTLFLIQPFVSYFLNVAFNVMY